MYTGWLLGYYGFVVRGIKMHGARLFRDHEIQSADLCDLFLPC